MQRPRSRRALLRSTAAGIVVAAAGCIGSDDSDAPTTDSPTDETATDSPTETPTDDHTAIDVGEGDWPTFRHDAGNSGYAPDVAGLPSGPTAHWRISANDGEIGYDTPPSVSDGTVFLGRPGGVEAVSAATGERKWYRPLDGAGDVTAAVTVNNGVACAADGSVHALDPGDGSEHWTATDETGPLTAPTAAGDLVIALADPYDGGTLVALDAADGAERWRFEFDGTTRSIPPVDDQHVYVSTTDGTTYAVAREDGALQWQSGVANESYGSPVVAGETVYVTDGAGTLYALRAADGAERWRAEGSPGINSPGVAVGDDAAYVCDEGKIVARAVSDGRTLWETEFVGDVPTAPAVAGQAVHFGTSDGRVYAVFPDDGEELWRFQVRRVTVGDQRPRSVSHGPAVVDGAVFVTTDGGDVYGFGDSRSDG